MRRFATSEQREAYEAGRDDMRGEIRRMISSYIPVDSGLTREMVLSRIIALVDPWDDEGARLSVTPADAIARAMAVESAARLIPQLGAPGRLA